MILAALLVLVLLAAGGVCAQGPLLPVELQRLAGEYLDSGDQVDRDRLLAYVRKSTSRETKGLARFALGMGDHKAENHAQAAEELEKEAAEMAELADYARYYQARSLAAAEKFGEAAGLLAGFERSFAESRLVPGAGRLRAESLIRSEQRDQARKLLEAEKSPVAKPVRLWLLGRIEELDGKPLRAVRTYRQAYYKYPLSPQAEEAEKRLDILRRKLGERYPAAPSSWRLGRADVLFRASKYPRAGATNSRFSILNKIVVVVGGIIFCLGILDVIGWLPEEPAGQTDVEALRAKAEQGDAGSQSALGAEYYLGRGMPQDYAEAAKWFRMAAEQGDAEAQYNLGVRYGTGQGVARDYVQADMWLNLAASRSQGEDLVESTESTKLRELLAEEMTPDQIAEAQRLAREWKPKTWDELKNGLEAKSR